MTGLRFYRPFLVLIVLAALACGGFRPCFGEASPAETLPHHLPPGTWVVMGSSTAAGAGAPRGQGWVDLLRPDALRYGGAIVNIARGGAVTYQGLSATLGQRPDRPLPDPAGNIDKALSLDPALLILAYPSNDTAVGYASEETVANLLAIRRLALSQGVPVLLLSTQPRQFAPERLARLALIDERLAAVAGPCFVPLRPALAAEDGLLAPRYDVGDGVHPNAAGHLVIAARVRDVLHSGQCVAPALPPAASPAVSPAADRAGEAPQGRTAE